MNKINIITAPDKLHSRSYKFLLIYPTQDIEQQLQQQIAEWDHPIDIYIYKEPNLNWLLEVFEMANTVIYNLDDSDPEVKYLGSYLVSFPKTYWLTQGEHLVYNKLSMNKVYNLDFIQQLIGGISEV